MDKIIKIANDYFDYLAKNYPVMCLSDEFYFFPRAKKAADFLDSLDSLDAQKIKQDIRYVRNLQVDLGQIDFKQLNLEEQIDLIVLNQSMATFLREFGQIKIWQLDPTLYLKIALLGIDQILSSFSFIKHDFDDNLRSRIAQIPRLLNEAKRNLKKIPLAYLETALEMVRAAVDYFNTTAFVFKNKRVLFREISSLTKNAIHSLEALRKFLIKNPCSRFFIKDKRFIGDVLKYSFSYNRSLKDIFEIAADEYHNTLKALTQIAEAIKPSQSWQKILSAYRLDVRDEAALLELYSEQIQKIRNFLKKKDVIAIPRTQNILVRSTPHFMRPMRASASYSSPVTSDRREPAYFYTTTDFAEPVKRANKSSFFSDIHNEYIFVSAHETYPGHHLLDTMRRGLKNPIRRQIESPLFYEGWASYAERLLDQLGYIENPLQRLVGLRRQAWRAVRAMLDVGLRIDKLEVKQAEVLLTGLGYELKSVKLMLRHYILTPGYQLCYTMGKFEIERLARQFCPNLDLKKFHELLLGCGQVPFDLIERRIKAQLCQQNS